VIDVARDSVIATIAVGDTKPVGVVISPNDKRVYVAEGRGAQVTFIDATTNTVVDSIAVGRRPWGIALSHDGERLYTADGGSNTVTVIDIPRRHVIATVTVGEKPYDVLYVPPAPPVPSSQR
jgi:YVTN family beta-propeller protein